MVGDDLFVRKKKYSYGLAASRSRSPPTFLGRIGAGAARGDVVVFKLPRTNPPTHIKRVSPARRRIQMIEGVLPIKPRGAQGSLPTRFEEPDAAAARQALPRDAANGVSY